MNSELPDVRDNLRDRELRNALVSTATLTKYTRVRIPRALAIGAIAAFVVAGAATGGAVAAASTISSANAAAQSVVQVDAQEIVGEQDGTIIGEGIGGSALGTLHLDLGTRPAGATGYVESSTCASSGDYVETIAGQQRPGGGSCDPKGISPAATYSPTAADAKVTITLTASSSARLSAWAAWVNAPTLEPSAAQKAEIADGTVTRAEYLAAFNRYAGCLAAAGYPLGNVDESASVLDMSVPGAAVDSGADNRCYVSEWGQVDALWQDEDWKNTPWVLTVEKCLTAQGVTPDLTSKDALSAQLDANPAAGKCAGAPN